MKAYFIISRGVRSTCSYTDWIDQTLPDVVMEGRLNHRVMREVWIRGEHGLLSYILTVSTAHSCSHLSQLLEL